MPSIKLQSLKLFSGGEKTEKKDKEDTNKSAPGDGAEAAVPGNKPYFGWLSSGLGLLTIDVLETVFTACIYICLKGHAF